MTGWIVVLVLILIIILVIGVMGYLIYKKITGTVKHYSRMIFGTSNPIQGMKQVELMESETRKTVSGATNLLLPQIARDFPEFQYEEAKSRAQNVLISYLQAINASNAGLLTEGMDELKRELESRIQMNRNREVKAYYERIKVHQMEIMDYRKEKGRCNIILQAAVEYIHYVIRDGRIIEGRKDLKTQTRYNVTMAYIQDRDTVENIGESGMGLNCPNCGAPLTSLGAKICPYCDTPVVEFNIHTWDFSSVREV